MRPPPIPIPARMQGLPLDKRGYPVPVIILRAKDGRPLFQANDSDVSRKCALRKLCPICGQRLDKGLWFVGGPRAAFDSHGRYFDTAMHHECMTYALQVCPYLAMPKFLTEDSEARIKSLSAQAASGKEVVLVDPTQVAEKPVVFVAVMSYGQSIDKDGLHYLIAPLRPYHAVEYWLHGQRLSDAEGLRLVATLYKTRDRPIAETSVRAALRLVAAQEVTA